MAANLKVFENTPRATLEAILDTSGRQVCRLAVFMGIINLLFPPVLYIYAEMSNENPWRVFYSEKGPLTWFSTFQLMMIGFVAYANYRLMALSTRLRATDASHGWIWLVFAAAFVFLALDEYFRYHENIREHVIMPGELFVDLPYVKEGEVLLYLYFVVGLVFAGFLFRELCRWPQSLVFFAGALALALVVIVVDALPYSVIHRWPGGMFWKSGFEETGEIWAQFLFLLSFLVVLNGRLRQLKERAIAPDQHDPTFQFPG